MDVHFVFAPYSLSSKALPLEQISFFKGITIFDFLLVFTGTMMSRPDLN